MVDFYGKIEDKDEIPLEVYQTRSNDGIDVDDYIFLWNLYEPKLLDLDFWLDTMPLVVTPSKIYGKNIFYVVFPGSCNLLIKVSALEMLKSSALVSKNDNKDNWAFKNNYFGDVMKFTSSALFSAITNGKYKKLNKIANYDYSEHTFIKTVNDIGGEMHDIHYDKSKLTKEWKLPLFENFLNNFKWTRAELKVAIYDSSFFTIDIHQITKLSSTNEELQVSKIEHKIDSNILFTRQLITNFNTSTGNSKTELLSSNKIVFDN